MEIRKDDWKTAKMKQKGTKKGEGRAGTAIEFAEIYPRSVHLKYYFK